MHDHGTRNARNNLVDIPQVRTQTYGHFSIKSRCANIWNILQNTLRKDLLQISHSHARKYVMEHFFKPVHLNSQKFQSKKRLNGDF